MAIESSEYTFAASTVEENPEPEVPLQPTGELAADGAPETAAAATLTEAVRADIDGLILL